MYFSTHLPLSRIYNVLLIGGCALILSCQSDPMLFDPPNTYEYQFHSFPLNLDNSSSEQIEPNLGSSVRLYTGIINTSDTTVDTAYTLLRLLPDIINDHAVCDADSKDSVSISLSTLDTIATEIGNVFSPLFNEGSLNIYFVDLNQAWDDEVSINTNTTNTILNSYQDSPPLTYNYREKTLIIEFDDDSTIISQWCENPDNDDFGFLITYSPDEGEALPFIEFHSSENTIESSKPKLNFSYKKSGDTTYVENCYSINPVSIGNNPANLEQPYMIIESDSANWGKVFAFNIPDDAPPPVLSNFFESIQDTLDDIILETQTDSVLELVKINVTRNVDYSEDIDSITFWLDNVIAYKSIKDPAGDNYTKCEIDSPPECLEDTTGTEGNQSHDWEDNNNDNVINYSDFAELYYDYGTDGCVDSLECGANDCIADGSCSISPYNPYGTEGNGQLNWVDNDNNDIWSTGDSGEQWWDFGTDWCPDSLETGAGDICDNPPCNCSTTINNDEDPNGDNFDPIGDDWHEINNPDSTEGNQQWDPGEPFYDWGADMVPGIPDFGIGPDQGEGNNSLDWYDENSDGDWDDGEGEQWFDTGSDGKYNEDEIENYSSINRTEGNFEFDTGEQFLDCGAGEEQFDIDLNCVPGDLDDDYNIDPNQDNFPNYTEGTEGNNLFDEGEYFEDLGFDHLTDPQEAFIYSQLLMPSNQGLEISPDIESKFTITVDDEQSLNPQPTIGSANATIWISEINKIQDEYSWDIIISVYTTIALRGLQFQLQHTPLTKDETISLTYQTSVSQIEENKLYQDITLIPDIAVPDADSLNNNLMVNYSTSLVALLDFTGLKDTLNGEEGLIFSHEYSNLVLYRDTSIILHENMNLIMKSQPVDNSEIIRENIFIETDVDSLVIPMGPIMQDFENGTLESYLGIYLESEGTSYNYDQIRFIYDAADDGKKTRLNLTYRRR